MEPVGDGGASSTAERYCAEAARAFQHYRAAPHMAGRWVGTLLATAVSYGLCIYLLNLLIGFLSPMVDGGVAADMPRQETAQSLGREAGVSEKSSGAADEMGFLAVGADAEGFPWNKTMLQ